MVGQVDQAIVLCGVRRELFEYLRTDQSGTTYTRAVLIDLIGTKR